jgi:hypothetical protein
VPAEIWSGQFEQQSILVIIGLAENQRDGEENTNCAPSDNFRLRRVRDKLAVKESQKKMAAQLETCRVGLFEPIAQDD